MKNDVVKKTGLDELGKKINAAQTTDTSNNSKNNEIDKRKTDHDHINKYITT